MPIIFVENMIFFGGRCSRLTFCDGIKIFIANKVLFMTTKEKLFGYTFDLWEGNNSAAGYYVYTFIPHGTAGQGNLPTGGSLNVDMKTFFNWLQANRSNAGSFSNSMYLDVVEAGLEVTRGDGWAYVTANINAN